jgi:thiamine-phosphate pyrophosphorylase
MTLPRFYPILDTGLLAGRDPEAATRAILAGGARILQLRHKEQFTRAMFETAERLAVLCREAGAIFILNDRADYAAVVGAGCHVGQDDLPPEAARRIIGAAPLGFSTHNEAQLRGAPPEPDYLALGPIFATGSKANPDPVVGVKELARLRPFSTRPVVAIGGITRSNSRSVLDAGADSVAVIGDLLAAESLEERTREWIDLLN